MKITDPCITLSSSLKANMKRRFTEQKEGKTVNDIEVKLNLSILKNMLPVCIKGLYNYLTYKESRKVISNA